MKLNSLQQKGKMSLLRKIQTELETPLSHKYCFDLILNINILNENKSNLSFGVAAAT